VDKKVYLASRSPRRRELLKQIGVNFEVLIMRSFPAARADVDETPHPGEPPGDYVLRVARSKAEIGCTRLLERRLPRLPVVGADTSVALGGEILGKPADRDDAIGMLHKLADREHEVYSAVAVGFQGGVDARLSVSKVRFAPLSDALIADYVASGEPMDKAGAYGIQGKAAVFIAAIEGSYSGIMGLPLFETAQLLKQIGIAVL
jgi:septum formation protein